jgi:hypothetical protein
VKAILLCIAAPLLSPLVGERGAGELIAGVGIGADEGDRNYARSDAGSSLHALSRVTPFSRGGRVSLTPNEAEEASRRIVAPADNISACCWPVSRYTSASHRRKPSFHNFCKMTRQEEQDRHPQPGTARDRVYEPYAKNWIQLVVYWILV